MCPRRSHASLAEIEPLASAARHATLTAALAVAAEGGRGIVLVRESDREEERSYRAVLGAALRRAAALRARGLERGERVMVVLETSFEFVEVFFGVMLAGGVPVPAYPPLAMARLEAYGELLAHVAELTRARFLVSDAATAATLGHLRARCPGLEELLAVEALDGDPARFPPREPDRGTPGFIQCTSGSTSRPKATVLLHRNLIANLEGMAEAFELSAADVLVMWLPLYHDMGLIGGLLSAVASGLKLVMMPPSLFLLDPGAWWRAVSRHRGTVTAAPNFAYGICARRLAEEELAGLDLSSVRVALCGAEPIQPATVERFTATMARTGFDARAFFPAYGLAESCVGVTMSRPGQGLRLDRVSQAALADAARPRALPAIGRGSVACVCVGRAIRGTRVSVRDEAGRELAEGEVGEVCVAGLSVMDRYLDDPEATERALRGGVLHTGDLGYLRGGELHVIGRKKNMLIVRGKNYYAEDVEAALEEVEGVRRGNAIAYGVFDEARGCERLEIALETRLRGEAERAALAARVEQAVADAVGLVPARVVLLAPGQLPKTSSGKKRRQACREEVASGAIHRRRLLGRARFAMLARSRAATLWHALRRRLARPPTVRPSASDASA
jgi:acyl-CoA synthetase (AMP-forming)/AMP-acid ligase II